MSDNMNNDDISGGDILADALGELMQLINPEDKTSNIYNYFYYLLLLWAPFRIYQVEPYVPMPEEAGGTEAGAGGFQIIDAGNGRQIVDYGFMLATSAGEDYGKFSTAKLLETINTMIGILLERGATLVGVAGLEIAKRAAWMKCRELGLEICNFDPTFADISLYNQITSLKERAKKNEALLEPRPS